MINILNNQIKFKEKHLMLHKTPHIDPKNFNQILKERKSKFSEYSYALKGSATSRSQVNKSLSLIASRLKSLPSISKRIEIKDTDKNINMSFLSQAPSLYPTPRPLSSPLDNTGLLGRQAGEVECFNSLNKVSKLNNSFLYKNSTLKPISLGQSTAVMSQDTGRPNKDSSQKLSTHVINSETNSSLNIVKTFHNEESGQETNSQKSKTAIKKFSANKNKSRSSQSLINITEKVSISKNLVPHGFKGYTKKFSSLTFSESNKFKSGKEIGSRDLINFINFCTFSTNSVKLEKDRGNFKDPNSKIFLKDYSDSLIIRPRLLSDTSTAPRVKGIKAGIDRREIVQGDILNKDKGFQKGENFENFSGSKIKILKKILSKDFSPKVSPSLNFEEKTVNTEKQFVPARKNWSVNANRIITADSSNKLFAFKNQLETHVSKEKYKNEVEGRKKLVLEFRKRVVNKVSEGKVEGKAQIKNKNFRLPANIYLSRFRGSTDFLENSKKGRRFQNYYEYQNEKSYSFLQAKRMKITEINNLLKSWDISWAKRKKYFVKLSNYTLVASDFSFLKNISNIRKIIDSKYKFDLFLSSSQSINYSFNKNYTPSLSSFSHRSLGLMSAGNGAKRKIDLNSLYKFLKYTFSSISALISKPVYVHSPEKICISLFYFMMPKISTLRKERKLKFLIRKKSGSAKDQKHKNIFNKIMTKFKIKEFLANWKESNHLVRLANVSEGYQINNLLKGSPEWEIPSFNANLITPNLSQTDPFKLSPSEKSKEQEKVGRGRIKHLFVGNDLTAAEPLNNSKTLNTSPANLFNSELSVKRTTSLAEPLTMNDFEELNAEDTNSLGNALTNEVIHKTAKSETSVITKFKQTDNFNFTNTLFNLNNGNWAETNLLQFRANQLAHLILSMTFQEISSTVTDTEFTSPTFSKLAKDNNYALKKEDEYNQKAATTPFKLTNIEDQKTVLLSVDEALSENISQESKTDNFKLQTKSIAQHYSLILSSNLYEEKFSYLISNLDSSVISYLFRYITQNNQLTNTALNLPRKSESNYYTTISQLLQKILSKSLKENLLLSLDHQKFINPLENLILKTKASKILSEVSKFEVSAPSLFKLDVSNQSHLLDKSLFDTPELTLPNSERGTDIEEKFESKKITEDKNHNLNEGFDKLRRAEINSDFLTSLVKQSSSSSLLKYSEKSNFKNGFNSLQLLKFRDIPTMISLNDKISQYLVSNLEILFDKEVEVDLTRIRYPYHDSNILSQILKKSSYKKTFRDMMKKLLYIAIIKNPTNLIRKQDFSIIPSYLSGIKVRLAGRISTQRVIPRFTVQSFQMGSLARGKVNFVETSRITHKNKRGAFSFTVTTSHFFENKKTKE